MPGKPSPDKQCTAYSKRRPGERCEAWAMKGRDVCYHHGGRSPVAAGSPHFKDGARSKYRAIFSGDALEHYAWARDDPRYLEMREEIAMLDTLLLEELMAAKVGQGGALWEELGRVWTRFEESSADATKDATTSESSAESSAEARRALRRMGEIITDGVNRHAAQTHALDILERKRKTSETERKRIVGQERTVTQAQAMSLVAAVVATVKTHVTDRETLAAIHADFARLVHQHVAGQTEYQ